MRSGSRILSSDGPETRLGRLVLAGEVVDDEPVMPPSLRVMDDYVLSVVFAGRGTYRGEDGTELPIGPGAVTVVHPGQPHWYRTAPGERWTELFAVFNGPLFHTFAAVGLLANTGPRYPRPAPEPATLRAVLRARPSSHQVDQTVAEHQLLALADWLVDTARPESGSTPGPPIATAVERLTENLAEPMDMRALAAEVGLPYETFRRRFAAEVGQSPLSYRNTRRLRTAATLLRVTNLTTRQIADTLGYSDEFHLSRRFRAHFGVPPSVYRQSAAG